MSWKLLLVLCTLLPWSVDMEHADITVKLVYLKDGQPAVNQEITLFEGKPSEPSTVRIPAKTSQEGTATFHFSRPLPGTVWIDDNNGRIRNCAWEEQIPLDEIVTSGITVGVDSRFGRVCKGKHEDILRLEAKPGEVVIFVRRVSALDNLRHY